MLLPSEVGSMRLPVGFTAVPSVRRVRCRVQTGSVSIERLETEADLAAFVSRLLDGRPARLVGAGIYAGRGSPDGQIKANVGALYVRLDGGPGTTFYVKESGAGASTVWNPK